MHTHIIGVTGSGKTTLAMGLAQRAKSPCLVLDPIGDPRWKATGATILHDREQFMESVKRSHGCVIIVDESAELIGQYNSETFWLTTRGRHMGHSVVLISQRANQIAKTVRDQCSHIFAFRISMRDAKTLSDDWADASLEEAASLPQYHCLWIARFKRARILQLRPDGSTREINGGVHNSGTDRASALN